MRTITTSTGKTYDVDYAWAPLMDGSCQIMLQDNRPLSTIATEFEELTNIHFVDTETGEADYTGYSVLFSISRDSRGVLIKLSKE